MSSPGRSRRAFLLRSLSGLGASWAAAHYGAILEAAAYAASAQAPAAGTRPPLMFLSLAQGFDVEAMAGQIIPSDSTPGAREARVLYFIDRALTTFEQSRQKDYLEGLRDLEARVKVAVPGAASFASLPSEQQIHLLTDIERTPFFNLVRTHTITGFMASPIHGGNFNKIGWTLVGFDDSLNHVPPFGYYDALPPVRG